MPPTIMTPQEEFEVSMYRDYATALGWMVMQWSMMEVVFNRHLLRNVIPLRDSDVCNIVTSQFQIGDKIQVALKIGFAKRPSEDWFAALESVLNHIDNDLRPARNRLIHDPIVTQLSEGLPAVRADARASLKKPQSHKPRELNTYEEVPITPEDIWQLAGKIRVASDQIGRLGWQLYEHEQQNSSRKK